MNLGRNWLSEVKLDWAILFNRYKLASVIIIVPKPDGTIEICADCKHKVNPVIKNDTYLQPPPEKLFSKIQGGEKVSKINLTKAYLQVKLDDESQKRLTINASKVLKQPTRRLYGVKPATLIFQRFIENALANIPYTALKVDDIFNKSQNRYGSFRKHRKSIQSIKRNRCNIE